MRSRVLPLLLLAAAVLAPISTASATGSPSASPKGDADFHRPSVGVCYDYGIRAADATSAPKREVSCDEPHRAVTVAVPRVPGKIDLKDPQAAFDQVGVRCYRAMYKALGGTQESRALTAYLVVYYLPSRSELAKGARWARCDLILAGGSKLVKLPDPLLPATADDSTALCLVDENESATVCARQHRYRATGVVRVKGDKYPGTKKLDAIGKAKCASRTTSSYYLWRYPLKWSWNGGKHVVTCYTKTTK